MTSHSKLAAAHGVVFCAAAFAIAAAALLAAQNGMDDGVAAAPAETVAAPAVAPALDDGFDPSRTESGPVDAGMTVGAYEP
jgi:hypothetical protein